MKIMNKLLIFGTGDIAQLAHYYFQRDTDLVVSAFTVDSEYNNSKEFMGLPVADFEEVERQYPPDEYLMFIALSYAKVNRIRSEKYSSAKARGYRMASYLSSKATIFDNVAIGDNCFILENNTIQPFAKIGNNVTLWSGNHIGHHSIIKDNCFITSHVVVSGRVVVDENCFIGVNATLRDHVRIGRKCVIGAGSLIVKDTGECEVYSAAPAELSRVPSNRLRGI